MSGMGECACEEIGVPSILRCTVDVEVDSRGCDLGKDVEDLRFELVICSLRNQNVICSLRNRLHTRTTYTSLYTTINTT